MSRFSEAVEIARRHEEFSRAEIEWDFVAEMEIPPEEFLELATALIARVEAIHGPMVPALVCTCLLRGILIGQKMEALKISAPDSLEEEHA